MVTIKPSTRADKKLMAIFDDGTITHFGQRGAEDFTIHRDEKRKELYIKRHRANEDWSNPKTAGTLAKYILWNKPTLSASIADYKKRFNL